MKKLLAVFLAAMIVTIPFTNAFAADEDLPRVWSAIEQMTR